MAVTETPLLDGRDHCTNSEISGDVQRIATKIRVQRLEVALDNLGYCRTTFEALEAELLAANIEHNGASNRNNEALLGRSSKSTRRENKKRAKRAAAVKENPDLAGDLEKGHLGTDQLDAIASGSAKTGGAAAKDKTLIEKVKKANPDDANKIVRDFVDDYKSPGEHETIRKRLRRLRKVSKFWTDRDTKALLIEGDDQTIDEIITVMEQGANDLYHKDGGRDAAQGQRRTRDQRNYDALHQAITGDTEPAAEEPEAGHASDPETNAAREPESAGKSAATSKWEARRGSLSPKLYLTMTIEDFLAGSPEAKAIDGSRLPQSVLDRYMCETSIIGLVYDRNGQVLWQGREVRDPTAAQRAAVIARDGGCQICLAGPTGLHVHHVIPWNAPAKGKTDIENLVGLCTDCHIWLHENNLTLYKNDDGIWDTRPATPQETPPARPKQSKQPPPKPEQQPQTASTEPPPDGRAPPNGNSPPETEQPPPDKPTFILRCEVGREPPLW